MKTFAFGAIVGGLICLAAVWIIDSQTASGATPEQPRPSASEPITIDGLSEEQAEEICSRLHKLRGERELAAKNAEPKDPSWSHATEQRIRKRVEAVMGPHQYTMLQIDCRATRCELTMEGPNLADRKLAETLGKDIHDQPWADIVLKGYSFGGTEETWRVSHEWYRPRTESEKRLWNRMREQP